MHAIKKLVCSECEISIVLCECKYTSIRLKGFLLYSHPPFLIVIMIKSNDDNDDDGCIDNDAK